jgi:hypothetical protein
MAVSIIKKTDDAITLQVTIAHSSGRWEQFWEKVDQYGFPIAA